MVGWWWFQGAKKEKNGSHDSKEEDGLSKVFLRLSSKLHI
jgi:hypothetical protein